MTQKKKQPENEYEGQEQVSSILQDLGKLSYEDRQNFNRRWAEILNKENDKRSQSLDFDTAQYY